jgi:hypothetical protein
MTAPITQTIETGRARLIISEHENRAYVCAEIDGAGVSVLLTESQIVDAFAALRAIKRRVMLRRVGK